MAKVIDLDDQISGLLTLIKDVKKSFKRMKGEEVKVGERLIEVKDYKLYELMSYKSFEKFVGAEFGISRQTADVYTKVYRVDKILKESKPKPEYYPPLQDVYRKMFPLLNIPDLLQDFWGMISSNVSEEQVSPERIKTAVDLYINGHFVEQPKDRVVNHFMGAPDYDHDALKKPILSKDEVKEQNKKKPNSENFFSYDDEIKTVFRNFSNIRNDVILGPGSLSVHNHDESVVGYFDFKSTPYFVMRFMVDHPLFGIDMKDFLREYNRPDYEVEITDDVLMIHPPGEDPTARFLNNIENMILVKKKRNVRAAFEEREKILKMSFDESAFDFIKENGKGKTFIAIYNKGGIPILSFANIDGKLDSRFHPLESVDESKNDLGNRKIFIPTDRWKLLEGDYEMEFTQTRDDKGVSYWSLKDDANSLEYFIETIIEG